MSTKWYMDNGVLLSNNKEQTSDTSYNTGETQTCHGNWMKPDAKDFAQFCSNVQKWQICRDRIFVVT